MRLNLAFAFCVVLEPRTLAPSHRLRLSIVNYRDEPTAEVELTFFVPDAWSATEEAALSAQIPLNEIPISEAGTYLVRAAFDNHVIGTFPLKIERPGRMSSSET